MTLAVLDDGCGFNVAELGETDVLGLAGMRERAALAGGELDIHSERQQGTRVIFKVQLQEAQKESKRALAS
jgi:signal transduction histidine kinase